MVICYAVEDPRWTHQQKHSENGCIYINGCRNPIVQPQHLHMVPFIIFFIMIMIISIIMADYDYYDYYLKRLF